MITGITVGAYDMFHIGHLNVFRNARTTETGIGRLVVGVASDGRISKYKNKRPVFSENERMEMVKSCRYVDDCFINDGDPDKIEAYTELAVKYGAKKWFVGSDWLGSEKWKKIGEELDKIGCELVYLPHTDGISTTDIVGRILAGARPV